MVRDGVAKLQAAVDTRVRPRGAGRRRAGESSRVDYSGERKGKVGKGGWSLVLFRSVLLWGMCLYRKKRTLYTSCTVARHVWNEISSG